MVDWPTATRATAVNRRRDRAPTYDAVLAPTTALRKDVFNDKRGPFRKQRTFALRLVPNTLALPQGEDVELLQAEHIGRRRTGLAKG